VFRVGFFFDSLSIHPQGMPEFSLVFCLKISERFMTIEAMDKIRLVLLVQEKSRVFSFENQRLWVSGSREQTSEYWQE